MTSQSQMEIEDAPLKPLHRRVFTGGALGQLTDGYILGSIGIAMSLAAIPLQLDAFDMGLIGASSLIGILVGSLIFGPLADRYGRSAMFLASAAAFIILSASQYFITSSTQLIIVRLLLGIAIGADYAVGVTLASEWMPKRYRAKTLGFMQCAWAAGFSCAYIVGYFVRHSGDDSWRWVLASCAIPSLITFLVRIGTPESPVWLIRMGRAVAAQALVTKYIGSNFHVRMPEASGESSGFSALFGPNLKRNTLVGAIFFACQIMPYFAISIFLPQIFQSFNVEDPYFYGIIFNLFLFLGIVFGTWIVDRVSRRAFLISTFYLCAATLTLLALLHSASIVYTAAILSVFSFTISASAVLCYVYPPELFPVRVRATGIGFTVACSRIGAASGTFLLPILLSGYGTSAALAACILSLVVGGVVCHVFAPETSETRMAKV